MTLAEIKARHENAKGKSVSDTWVGHEAHADRAKLIAWLDGSIATLRNVRDTYLTSDSQYRAEIDALIREITGEP